MRLVGMYSILWGVSNEELTVAWKAPFLWFQNIEDP
jgi:hypothetical protein